MAITFSIPNTEIILTAGQTTVTAQNLMNAIREFEDDFIMMSSSRIVDASGKAPLGGSVFTEIVMTLLEGNEGPWTIRFADEATAHTSVTGGTFLATDTAGNPRPVTTNFSLTINQSVSGTLVETSGQPAKGVVLSNFKFYMVLSSDHVSPALGLTVTAQRSRDNEAFNPTDNVPTERSNGIYEINLTAADMNGDVVGFRFSAPGADDRNITIVTAA